MYNFDFLLSILDRIDKKEKVSVKPLAEVFGVSQDTIYAYIRTLKDADFPIYYDRVKDSYVFREGFSFRRPNISKEEWLTLALAKKIMGNFGSNMEKSISNIEQKPLVAKLHSQNILYYRLIKYLLMLKTIFP